MKHTLRYIGAALCLAMAFYFLAPLFLGVCHIGMFYPAALALLFAAALLFPQRFARLFRSRFRPWAIAASVLLAIGLTAVVAILAAMGITAAHGPAEDTPPCTVIVLGCQITEDNRPSIMLQSRINAAYDYLATHPDAVCIASGAMADDERSTEASCIRESLIAMGIASDRIYSEEHSRSTAENLTFSKKIIEENDLPRTVAIASDNFHQLRGAIFARRADLTPYALGCRSVWYLGAGYWAREVVGVVAAILRGY